MVQDDVEILSTLGITRGLGLWRWSYVTQQIPTDFVCWMEFDRRKNLCWSNITDWAITDHDYISCFLRSCVFACVVKSVKSVKSEGTPGAREPGKRNYRELSTWVDTWKRMEQRKFRKRQRNLAEDWETLLPGIGEWQSLHNCVAAWFPSVSCSAMRFSDSFVSCDGTEGWRSCQFCFCALNRAKAWYIWQMQPKLC
jgi:hypothetical protein